MVVAIVEQIARREMYVVDCWVMASCSLVRGQVWEEHTPLYSRYKHRCFDRNTRLFLTEINASEKNTATTSSVKFYPEHGGRTVRRNTHTHHADMQRRSGACGFCTGFDGDDELSAPRPSGHYMYRTVVTICTAQWSLYVPPV